MLYFFYYFIFCSMNKPLQLNGCKTGKFRSSLRRSVLCFVLSNDSIRVKLIHFPSSHACLVQLHMMLGLGKVSVSWRKMAVNTGKLQRRKPFGLDFCWRVHDHACTQHMSVELRYPSLSIGRNCDQESWGFGLCDM